MTAHREMVLQGLGVALLPDFIIRTDLAENRVADIYPHELIKFKYEICQKEDEYAFFSESSFAAPPDLQPKFYGRRKDDGETK